ncbi:MAG: hypothetical protein ACD_52C00175G0008 [uncultured bacterium]|uniref:Uncharacterized protein n=1 Tax=Candidatus Woesebacteria bacterium RIFCSPHIGHO2_12_FULL_41_24 TaxID=1802510 RepID=A0A1F8AUD3_9BACT|nr:MAG: hypothetical protein ACD_52C00175G0008 [uncultured bacterium]OGM15072.1 MAG: hypothetical protein A2W15_04575 [Candidatus Woesebacteria bacterium RBG_16_41_13]OGM28976.1 MAG: hypothetical protein A2873_01490 [Candidatus Woesebacteria bacterium RIFCSPHIGHO2_01_FULL_42_80]OGM35152.1 MAG: hypothetical protein A3D84_02295 [Candidatus Woesebacteria bacterium RIFCSPHIGHO2_02_FULL_42_20]OGM54888.1 MAG: hypothetical protein A3E44_01895 [Candidatus Woesebacteria bacterium RIFCSPHIGHO2_12_FULL_41
MNFEGKLRQKLIEKKAKLTKGLEVDSVKLISSNSPLGAVISGKNKGEEFVFNERKGKILG